MMSQLSKDVILSQFSHEVFQKGISIQTKFSNGIFYGSSDDNDIIFGVCLLQGMTKAS